MESKYKTIKHIGEGAFSSVILALNIETGEKVAIKKMKKRRWKDTAAMAEISALQRLHHENIIRLLDVFREDYRSFLVFECMDCDLNELVVSRNGRRLPETVILDITYQVLNGLDFIHRNDLFHRDIKPENVLIRRHITKAPTAGDSVGAIVVEAKIADFGLVHDLDFSRPLTDYISTRWYRAPEVLLNCANYSTPIDVWAVGTIVAELATLRPLFPGSNQIDQLRRIFDVLGTPRISAPVPSLSSEVDTGAGDPDSWYEGAVHARKLGIAFVPSTRRPVATVMPDVSVALSQLVDYLLVLNPATRPTARDALAVVSRMLDHTLGEAPNEDAACAAAAAAASVDGSSAEASVPEEIEMVAVDQKVPSTATVVSAPAPGVGPRRLPRIPSPAPAAAVGTPTRVSDNTADEDSPNGLSADNGPVDASELGDGARTQPPPMRPSLEISIVHGVRREPLRDPRADLSDFAVSRGQPSATELQGRVDSKGTTGQSLIPLSSFVHEEAAAYRPGEKSSASSLHHSSSASNSGGQGGPRVRRAAAIASFIAPSPRSAASTASSSAYVPSAAESDGFVPLRSTAHSTSTVNHPAPPPVRDAKAGDTRVQGLRFTAVAGSPLIRRALSVRKKTTPAEQHQQQHQHVQVLPNSNYHVDQHQSSSSSSLLKRSRSALLATATLARPGDSSAASLARLELSPDVHLAVGERIDLSDVVGGSNCHALPLPPPSLSGTTKADEWIANTQLLRQCLAHSNIGGGSVGGGDGHVVSPRLRKDSLASSSGNHVAASSSSSGGLGFGDVFGLGFTLPPESRRESSLALDSGLSPSSSAVAVGAGTLDRGLIADEFAPVTFDAGALFPQSLLADASAAAPPAMTDSPLSYYREDAAMPSPGDKIATFNDVRLKYSSRKAAYQTLPPAAAAPGGSGGGGGGGHRFLSKVKNAFTGSSSNNGRHHHQYYHQPAAPAAAATMGGNANVFGSGSRRLGSHDARSKSSGGGRTQHSSATSLQKQEQPPRLDFDFGASLLTPESLHRVPREDAAAAASSSSSSHHRPSALPAVSNDSAYYLIDYINGQPPATVQPSAPLVSERSDSHGLPPPPANKARTARRIVNMSTRSRQTQYDYSFGSQIFECLDKDLVLLKTDVFREFGEQYGIAPSLGSPPPTQPHLQIHAQMHSLPHQQRQKQSSASNRPNAPRKKPMDVTKVTAKTAAAINNIVAGNAKARSTLATTNSGARQLVI